MCKFDMMERNFVLRFCFYYCLYILPKSYLLFSFSYDSTLKSLFYTKYFVLLDSIDVVSTPSYRANKRDCQKYRGIITSLLWMPDEAYSMCYYSQGFVVLYFSNVVNFFVAWRPFTHIRQV